MDKNWDTTNSNIDVYVGGTFYRFKKSALEQGKCLSLKKMVMNNTGGELSIERPKDTFDAILAYHITGKLHLPPLTCPRAFQEELDFWQVSVKKLDLCCYRRMLAHYRDEKTLSAFLQRSYHSESQTASKTRFGQLRRKIWKILDHQDSSLASKVYFVIAFTVILLSIFSIALSTLPNVRVAHSELQAETTQPTVFVSTTEGTTGTDFCRKLYLHFAEPGASPPPETTTIPGYTEGMSSTEIDLNDSTSTEDSDRINLARSFNFGDIIPSLVPENAKVKIPTMKLAIENNFLIYFYIECLTVIFFSIELLFRLITCPNILSYVCNCLNVAEIIMILASYIRFIFYLNEIEDDNIAMDIMLYVQAFRVFRLLRIMRNVTAFQVLSYSIEAGKKDLCVLFFYICIGLVIFSNIIYLVESSDNFPSIPDAWWWSAVTITTVGYGDVVPKSVIGKVVGGVCAISGVVLLSLIIPVFVNTFIFLYQFAGIIDEKFLENEKEKKGYSGEAQSSAI